MKNFSNILERLKKNQLLKDSLWSLIGNSLGKGLALIAGILIARFLGKDIYGEYGVIKTTILSIGVFSTFGLGYTATKYISEYRIIDSGKIPQFLNVARKITLVFSGCMAMLVFLFSDFIAIRLFSAAYLSQPLKILSILIIFNAFVTTQIGILSGFGNFKEIAKVNSFVGLLTFIFSLPLTYLYGLNGALTALLLVQVMNFILNYIIIKKELLKIPSASKYEPTMLRNTINFSLPIALQESIYAMSSWLSIFILIRFSNYGEVGLYSAAIQWNSIILFIPSILRNVVLSHLSKNSNNQQEHSKILKYTTYINIVATLIPSILIFLFSPLIAKIYGESFEGISVLISLAVFITVFSSVSNVYTQAYISIGKNWLMFLLKGSREFLIIITFIMIMYFSDLSGAKSIIYSNLICSIVYMFVITSIYSSLEKSGVKNI